MTQPKKKAKTRRAKPRSKPGKPKPQLSKDPVTGHIRDLVPDADNCVIHDERNMGDIVSSLQSLGLGRSILVDGVGGNILAGNGVTEGAAEIGLTKVKYVEADGDTLIAVVRSDLTAEQKAEMRVRDNQAARSAKFQIAALDRAAEQAGKSLRDLGFQSEEIERLRTQAAASQATGNMEGEDDAPPDTGTEDERTALAKERGVELGQTWALGDHRIVCGDSTKPAGLSKLVEPGAAVMIHADPPYGMGKVAEGIDNDNLRGDRLCEFQMRWWNAWRPFLADNGSVYIWGGAEDLWRLWYAGGLKESERLTFRNEITWRKGSAGAGGISHIGSEELRQYPNETERCLFFMVGEQGFNKNADNYWEGWEPIRSWLSDQRKASGLTVDRCNQICGKQNMRQAAFTRGGFRLILREDYEKLRQAVKGKAFKRDYDDLEREYGDLKREYGDLKREFYATRAHFDNTHDNMTDVWDYPRVQGEDREGHPAPKPVAMIGRAILSSSKVGDVVLEPFLGSGSTLMAADASDRVCVAYDNDPGWVAVSLRRWEKKTGQEAHVLP